MRLLDWLLEKPSLYNLSQQVWYRTGQQEAYVRDWIRPRRGDHILDIGCGAAAILQFLPSVEYVGYDPNPRYIAQATQRYGARGRFVCRGLTELQPAEQGTYDIVLANGVLHHLTDEEARVLVRIAWEALKPAGRLITRDGCYEEPQPSLARFLLRSDRGAHVRTQNQYEEIFREKFEVFRSKIARGALRLPYSLIHFEATKS